MIGPRIDVERLIIRFTIRLVLPRFQVKCDIQEVGLNEA